MGTYIIATLLFLALAYALYKTFSKRGKCCGNCDGCGSGGGCCGGHHHDDDQEKQDCAQSQPFLSEPADRPRFAGSFLLRMPHALPP